MNNNAKKWVQALRSGEYVQGRGSLRTLDGRHCCLGVACDLHAKETGQRWNGVFYLGEKTFLPIQVTEWLGLGDNNTASFEVSDDPRFRPTIPDNLANQNDTGLSYNELADIIEAEPEGLFDE